MNYGIANVKIILASVRIQGLTRNTWGWRLTLTWIVFVVWIHSLQTESQSGEAEEEVAQSAADSLLLTATKRRWKWQDDCGGMEAVGLKELVNISPGTSPSPSEPERKQFLLKSCGSSRVVERDVAVEFSIRLCSNVTQCFHPVQSIGRIWWQWWADCPNKPIAHENLSYFWRILTLTLNSIKVFFSEFMVSK